MKYDIDLYLKILDIIDDEGGKIPITHLKSFSGVHATRLEYHLEQLVDWHMIVDTKPTGPGKARIVSFARDISKCKWELVELKDAIKTVNKYFPSN